MQIHVYTREVNPENYPEGLAGAIHFACIADAGERAFNRNYGILFAKGLIRDDNTIQPMRAHDPKIFAMNDGNIGICAERILEDGSADETMEGKVLFWKTRELIHFTEEEIISADTLAAFGQSGRDAADEKVNVLSDRLSDRLEVDDATALAALKYWSPITCEEIVVPGEINARSKQDIIDTEAVIRYSDGSERNKKVQWDLADIDLTKPGKYPVKGHISQQRFSFPLANGYGDPVIFPWEGKWYYISTNDNLNDIGIYVREADDVHALFAEGVTEHLILPFDPERGFEQTFWAPEFHVIGGELYILFAVSGHVWGPQCHMMKKKKGGSIIDADSWEDPVCVCRQDGTPLATDAITLDMTYIKAERQSNVIWSYREHIGQPDDSGSRLYIASIDEHEPWKLTSEPVLLTRPLYGWENVSGTINNEGPYACYSDGMIHVTYSGGSANAYTYALGLLTARADADLTDPASWSKSITPVLTFYSVPGEYGPGHNAFFTNEDGELMISYHGETAIDGHLRCDGIRRVHFRKDGTPYFQMSADEDIKDADVSMYAVTAG